LKDKVAFVGTRCHLGLVSRFRAGSCKQFGCAALSVTQACHAHTVIV